MTREQMLLMKVAEEAAEVIQRASKAQRFGLYEVQPGQLKHNLERLDDELHDLVATVQMLGLPITWNGVKIARHQAQVEKYLEYSRELGILDDQPLSRVESDLVERADID